MLKTQIRIKALTGLSFLLISFLIILIIPQIEITRKEPAQGLERVMRPKKSGYWPNCHRIYINNDNWSATPLPWIQNRTGTWSDPHIIENVTIDAKGTGSGIFIENSNDFFIIRNCTVYNSGGGMTDAGIRLYSVGNGTLINNNASNNNRFGIYFYTCNNNTISGNIVKNNSEHGIFIDNCINNTISGNNATNNTDYGIFLNVSEKNIVLENNVYNNSFIGLMLENSEYNKISDNNVLNNSQSGICLYLSAENTVSGNIVINNGDGIVLYEHGSYNTISGNTFKNNGHGISIDNNCENNTIRENIILNNSVTGLEIYHSSCNNNSIYNNVFLNNTVHAEDVGSDNYWNSSLIGNYWDNYTGPDNAPFDGIGDVPYNLSQTPLIRDFLPIFQNPIHNGSKIHINESGVNGLNWSQTALVKWWCMGSGTYSDPYVIENLVIDSKNSCSGIFIENSNGYFIIRNCTVYNAGSVWYEAGIRLQSVSNGTIFKNNVSNNNYDGIYLIDSKNNTISGNTVNYNDYGIAMEDSSKNMVLGNIVENNRIRGIFLGDISNNTISGNTLNNNSNSGIALFPNSNNNTISGNIVNNSVYGIISISSYFNTVSGNTINNQTTYGIYLDNCDNNTISGNNVSITQYGIYFDNSNNNTVSGNTVNNNTLSGIYFTSSNINTVSGNKANENFDYGIYLEKSNYSIFSGNTIRDNDVSGVNISDSYSQYNLFYNNIFINNPINGIDNWTNNYWNNSVIGNYWSDYPGSDLNDDGIGDIPYNKSGIIDYLPIWDDGDSIKPIITINSPQDGTYWDGVPLINVSVFDANLDKIWYTVSNNTTKVFLQNNIEEYLDDTLWGNLPNGPFEIYFYANDSTGNIGNQNLTLYKHIGMWALSPFIIDKSGSGDYTWLEASFQGWCRGSGTFSDPYIIKNIIIDGQNSGSCIEIRNSDAYVVIRNSTFFNSGSGIIDAGIRLDSSSNVELLYDETSNNNGYGIYLSYCQDILIEGCMINDNAKSGIMLYESNTNIIRNNTDTINSNTEYGIYLSASHSNEISGNTINYNLIGIYLNGSNYNNIVNNDLQFNTQGASKEVGNCVGNEYSGNTPRIGDGEGAISSIIIFAIIGGSVIAVAVIAGTVIAKKKTRIPKMDKKEEKREQAEAEKEERERKERERNERERIQREEREKYERERAKKKFELESKFPTIKQMIQEKNFSEANKQLKDILDEAKVLNLKSVLNWTQDTKKLIEKKKANVVLVFISYALKDSKLFKIKEIAEELTSYDRIENVLYCEEHTRDDFIRYMNKYVGDCDIMILFCSPNSLRSEYVEKEWAAADAMHKPIIPVFMKTEHIPPLLRSRVGVDFNAFEVQKTIHELYNLILKKTQSE
ncbi:MAG: NosD domain-containing protein [Promethearchaeota archaeon]